MKKNIESYSIREVEKYDFYGQHKSIFDGVAVSIVDAVKEKYGQFTVFVLNHHQKRYTVGHTSNVRNYAYVIGRFLNHQRGSTTIPSLNRLADRNSMGDLSVEFIPASNNSFQHCMEKLRDWSCVGQRPSSPTNDNLVLVKATHKRTGWVRYFTVEDSKSHTVPSSRWNQLRISCGQIPNYDGVVNSAYVGSLTSKSIVSDHNKKIAHIKAQILVDISVAKGFSFDIVEKANDAIESKALRGKVREKNSNHHAQWFTKENIAIVYEAASKAICSVFPPQPAVLKASAVPISSSENLRKELAKVTQQIEKHPDHNTTVAETEDSNKESVEVVDFELDDSLQESYEARRKEHAKKITVSITLIGLSAGMDVDSLVNAIADVINASLPLKNIVGEVTSEIVKNALIHNTAPRPQLDFLFFEVLDIVSKFIEKKVCHE